MFIWIESSGPVVYRVDKSKILNLVLHCCDISHPSKDWDLHSHWTKLLLDEFFLQGDKEKQLGLPVSPLCDRATTLVPQSQIGKDVQKFILDGFCCLMFKYPIVISYTCTLQRTTSTSLCRADLVTRFDTSLSLRLCVFGRQDVAVQILFHPVVTCKYITCILLYITCCYLADQLVLDKQGLAS